MPGGPICRIAPAVVPTGVILTPLSTYIFKLRAAFTTSILGALAAFAAGAFIFSINLYYSYKNYI